MKDYKSIIFKKLAEKKEDFKIGDVVIFESSSETKFNGYVLKILGLNNGFATTEIIETKDTKEYPIGRKLFPVYSKIKLFQPPKPHEYSPVEMTGRYRTIGD